MNLSADMSIIEIDNLIKSLPKERLQKELESPTGHFPLYLVAGRLKEMESMEADAQAAAAEKKTSEQAPSVAHRLAMTQPPVMSEVAAAPQPQPQPDPAGQAAQMLMPTVNAAGGYSLPTVYAETGKQGANTSELVNQYLAELKSRKDKAREKRSKTDEFAVDNSGDFAKNMGKQPFGKGGIADLGSLADIRAAQVEREERSDPTPTPSDEKTKGRFTGGVSGVHRGVVNESENTEFDEMLAQLIKESSKSRSAKKANQGGYVNNLPTTYAQEGLYFEDDPRSQEIQSLDSEIQKIRSDRERMIDMYKGGGKVSDEEAAKYGASAYNPRLSPLLQERSDLVESAYSPEVSQISETAPKVSPPKSLSGTDVIKAMNAKTIQNRAGTDGAVPVDANKTGSAVKTDTASVVKTDTAPVVPVKKKDETPPAQLGPMPQLPKSAIIKSMVKRNSSLSGKNDGVSETKIVSNAQSSYMDKILSLSSKLEASDNASKVAMKSITDEIARLGTFKKGALKEVEKADKAVMDFAKTGKLPPERKDKLINSLLMTFGASLLGNPTLAGALSKGLMASQKIIRGEEDAYSDALSANLKSVQAMADSKITLETATANAKVKSLAFARQDARASDANRNAAIANLQTAENARLTALDRYQKNQLSAERNRIQMLQATQLTGPQITQLNREKVIQGKYNSYVSDFTLAENDAERRKVFEKYKPFFTVEPETKTLDINKPKLPAFNKDFKKAGIIKETTGSLSTGNIISLRGKRLTEVGRRLGDYSTKGYPPYAQAHPYIRQALDAMSLMPKYKNIDLRKDLKILIRKNPSIETDLERLLGTQHDERMGVSSGLSQNTSKVKASASGFSGFKKISK